MAVLCLPFFSLARPPDVAAVATAHLRPRYQRRGVNAIGAAGNVTELEPSTEDGYIDREATDMLDAVIELLLTALQHSDTVVRLVGGEAPRAE